MSQIDQQLNAVWSGHISRLQAASRGKRVVVVEGEDDRSIVEELLKRRRRDWARRFSVIAADGRRRALSWVAAGGHFAGAECLVDRDTWTEAELQAQQQELPLLIATSGWCLENWLLEAVAAGDLGTQTQEVLQAELEGWLRAGAFWWVAQRHREAINPWWEKAGPYGEPPKDLSLQDPSALERSLVERMPPLPSWEAGPLSSRWRERLEEVLSWPSGRQIREGVHGKALWRRLVQGCPELRRRWGEEDMATWLGRELAHRGDEALDQLLARLLA